MNEVTLAILGIIGLFILFLIFKNVFPEKIKKNFCALCFAASLTWIILIVLKFENLFQDKIILALLLGSSAHGILYVAEKHIEEKWLLFRLPFYLTIIIIAYSILEGISRLNEVTLIIGTLWISFGGLFFYRNNSRINSVIKKIIECCKNW